MMIHTKTLTELSAGLAAKEYSAEELARYFLARIKKHNPVLNAFITVTEAQAMAAAKEADVQRKTGKSYALTGIPIAHKDIFCTRDIKTSCGSRMLDNFIAPYDATLVEKMSAAGCLLLGKTNMDEFAMGSSNETSFYGAVKNPWDFERIPGGSSGGSAAAVAARLVPAATGTDTGGSIRQPASMCGITGLKPTYGRISRYGMIAFASSLDQAGLLAQTAEDCALLMNMMAGFDERDSTSANLPVPDYTANLNDDLHGLKIGLPREFFNKGLDAGIEKVIQQTLAEYQKLGAKIVDISLPNMHLSVPVYYVVAPAECSSNLSRFDGVRFGYRAQSPVSLEDLYKRSRGEGFGAEVKRRIMIGTYVLSAGYYDAYYLKAQQVRQLISDDFKNAFEQVDVIMGPTTPTTAFKLDEKTDDPIAMYLSDIYTIAVNLAGLPGLSIPVQMVNGLPAGLQIIGNHFSESRLLNVAHRYQQVTAWHKAIPAQFQA